MADAERGERFPLRVQPGFAHAVRIAVMLRRLDPVYDALHTFGEPALRAGRLGWRSDRGPIVHTRGWFERAVQRAGVEVCDPTVSGSSPLEGEVRWGVSGLSQMTVDRDSPQSAYPSPSPSLKGRGVNAPDRASIRKRLRVAPNELLIWSPGRIHRDAGQKLAAWALAILFVRDGRSKLLVSSTGDVSSIRGFAAGNRIARYLVESPGLSDAERALACDAAIVCATTDRFERTPILAAVRAGVPVYASPVAATVLREHGVITIDPPKPRLFARAIVERFDPAVTAS